MLPLASITIAALRRQQVRQAEERALLGAAWRDEGLVFASMVGGLLEPRNVNRRFEQLRERAGCPGHGCTT